jgi:chromosome segregation ATPase
VAPPGSDTVRDIAADLGARDDALALQLTKIAELGDAIGSLRARAGEIGSELDALPAEQAAAEGAVDDARAAAVEARADLSEAERRLEQVESSRRASEDDRARARSEAKVARETLVDAEHRIERHLAHRAELDDLGRALQAEADGLVVEARPLAAALRDAPRMIDAARGEPGSTLDELEDWAARARAALFVARGTLETERDKVVAEANALATAVTGEELPGTSVALARRRIEDALG